MYKEERRKERIGLNGRKMYNEERRKERIVLNGR